MKILIDVNHPAHVHYFRNFIKIMESKGHRFKIVNRNDLIINKLLDYHGIEHTIRNSRPKKKKTLSSLMYLSKTIFADIKKSFSFKPDIYIGFASSSCSITAALFHKPCILLEDTEHNVLNQKIYLKFCSCVLTPFYFQKNFGRKQLKFDAYIEQLYLHSDFFTPSMNVLNQIGVKAQEYILVRYISYDAHHDLNVKPITGEAKYGFVKELATQYRVYVSHENNDNRYFNFKLNISPEQMHDIEANALFVLSEGATMASESFILGVPYLYINPLRVGYVDEQVAKYPRMAAQTVNEREIRDIINKINDLPSEKDRQEIRKEIENQTINPTKLLVWFIENYPESEKIMQDNPDYQYNFK